MFLKACAVPLAALALIAAAPPIPAAVAVASDGQGSASSASPGAGAERTKAERKICKNFPDTVSRMRTKRLCLTQAQWREFDEAQE